jgi:ectoine hydroxylase-related dioxygenase (phytanoyl-CoA dioxygenase family)
MQSPSSTPTVFFRDSFSERSPEVIAATLKQQGFAAFEGVLRRQALSDIEQELARPIGVNTNDVAPVEYGHQTYFTHALCASQTYFELVTHPHLRAIAQAVLGADIRLKCQRYYLSRTGHVLPWHRDAKRPDGTYTGVRGVAVLMYLSDTLDGELQVLPGSHRWPLPERPSDATDGEQANEHLGEAETISMRAGSLVLFDTHLLHRTRPFEHDGGVRRSIFFQIDADLDHGERLLVDPSLVDPSQPELLQYLGFGRPAGYPAVPLSSLATLSVEQLTGLAESAMKELGRRAAPARLRAPIGRALHRWRQR